MSQEPKPPESSPTAPNSPRSKPRTLLRMLSQLGGIGLALVPVVLDLLRQLWQLILPALKWLSKQWAAVLPKVRSVLPGSFNKLPDQALTAIAIALVLLLLLLPRAFSPKTAPTVAETPADTEIVDQPKPQPTRPNPDAKRIAKIQSQLLEVSAPYAADLVQAIQADFARGQLLVSVGEDWQILEPSQREQLANEWFNRSKKLKFEQLEITDTEGTLLARSPVVGSRMVLLVTKSA